MRDKLTLSEKCIELANHVADDPDESVAPGWWWRVLGGVPDHGDMPRIGAEETYCSLETLLERAPAIRDTFGINTDTEPCALD